MKIEAKIKNIKAREILDSRGNPTVEVELITNFGGFRASVPSGASKGKYEARELRDGGNRYSGKGVLKTLRNVEEIIVPKLKGKDVLSQRELDSLMLKLDGTEEKSKLGVNAILPVSMAVCRAGAASKNLLLYRYISHLFEKNSDTFPLPTPAFNIINGGAHAGSWLALQEFMIVPHLKSFSKNLQAASEIYHTLKEILKQTLGLQSINVGDEGGFVPFLSEPEEALNFLVKAVNQAGYQGKVKLALDIAASEFYREGKYKMGKVVFSQEGLLNFYSQLLAKYPIISLEDPFAQDDWEGWGLLKSKVKSEKLKVLIFGDDLLATNIKRIKEAKDKNVCNGLIIKPNQTGTLTETLEAVKLAKSFGWKIMVSHRSGETNDDFISDLAVGVGADFIKAGAPARGERVAKYNRLLRVEEELKRI